MSPATAKDFLLASDLGLVRLKMAVRATMAVGFAALILSRLAQMTNQPITVTFMGVVVAMLSSITVADRSRTGQWVTLGLLPFAAAAVLSVANLLAAHTLWSILGFLAMTFAAIELRRYGPRWLAIGITCLMTYFCALFFNPKPESLPGMLVAIPIAIIITALVRALVMPERPASRLRWAIAGYDARSVALVTLVADLVRSPQRSTGQRKSLLRASLRLNEAALFIEDALDLDDVKTSVSAADLATLRHRIFETDIALNRVVESALRASRNAADRPAEREDLSAALLALRKAIRHRALDSARDLATEPPTGVMPASLKPALIAALAARSAAAPVRPPLDADAPAPSDEPWSLHVTTRQAIQATVAVAIAATVGHLVSPPTWSWAALAAFVAFSGTTRGDTLRRAAQRVGGTIVGLAAGIGFASVFTTSTNELVLIFVCIFCGIYMMLVDYAWATLWFSAMVAVLYKMLGRLSNDIVLLRVEQTLVGVAFAALATLLVLPVATRNNIGDALAKFLRQLEALLATAARREDDRRALVMALRELDRRLNALRLAVSPMLGIVVRIRARTAEGLLHDATAIVHYTREVTAATSTPHDEATLTKLRESVRVLAASVELRVSERRLPNLAKRSPDAAVKHDASSSFEESWIVRLDALLGSIAARLRLESLEFIA